MREFLSTDIYNALPEDLQNVIIDTNVVSSHGETSGEQNFTSTDKLYLLSTHEVFEDGTSDQVSTIDTSYNSTRQLDYYANLGVTTNNYTGAKKKNGTSNSHWWLRSADSTSTDCFLYVYMRGIWFYIDASYAYGVSPAFRIG